VLATIGEWAGEWAWIALWVTFAILIIGTSIRVCKWWLHKRPLRKLMEVTYFIPKAQYERKQFIGAPLQEYKPSHLRFGIGKYQVFFLHTPKTTLTPSYPPHIQLVGVDKNKPTIYHLGYHPFVVAKTQDAYGNPSWTDWHGVILKRNPSKGVNGQYTTNTSGFIVRGIQTFGNREGDVVITFCVKEIDKPIVRKLQLTVSNKEGGDQIPFLKDE